jgi:hypothetical protein
MVTGEVCGRLVGRDRECVCDGTAWITSFITHSWASCMQVVVRLWLPFRVCIVQKHVTKYTRGQTLIDEDDGLKWRPTRPGSQCPAVPRSEGRELLCMWVGVGGCVWVCVTTYKAAGGDTHTHTHTHTHESASAVVGQFLDTCFFVGAAV